MGPLVTREHRDKVAGYLDAGVGRRCASWWSTAATVEPKGDAGGFWLGPTLFDRVRARHVGLRRRDLRPGAVASSEPRRTTRHSRIVNASPYGNGTAIFTADGGAARRYQRDVQVGMIGINVPIPVPMAYYSFGGWKASLFGDTHAHGMDGIHFFTRAKVVTSRWPDPAQRTGVDLGFPRHD